ncbi:hypothetical protein FC83_GL001529 [Agrilactobacillus composti DSM 18527 = JCM 14202]|uniref:DNA-directed RNA polymerase beta subunit n=1 Tax=Agrilactobacillus composti DSM 18527 = JCM 14202 TaxID=1423734 RepID=X0PDB4_9LACO|nr:hypothetical protein [Agrilactobacillus composti]KRM30398.1 hypothetical protein FC83_GL001529 [Agrilactobacillus composti DSM 18527 = JCM 14202]GAF38868.1 hypothetical protein JCM14202_699 [Agrilactobacillus composti DSM 18527 = JCM 14202]
MTVYDPPKALWLYNDRGMLKWQGWFLSDHSLALEVDAKKGQPQVIEPQQSDGEIRRLLEAAFKVYGPIKLQLNILVNNQPGPDIVGTLEGIGGADQIVVCGGRQQHIIAIADIRHVTLLDPDKWYKEGMDNYA